MKIQVLDKKTIDEIAAGEVVERPSSVVKELVENSIDAGATAISIEIRNGGIDMIRVTDNGSGILREDLTTAFLPHATSKIRESSDLKSISSLGFRGEALSSIAAVSVTEVITKTKEEIAGSFFEASKADAKVSDIGAPDGTTFLVEHLFYNVPARRKFLKTAMTEGSYVTDLVERLALSHPSISFQLTLNHAQKLSTSGSGNIKELIYSIYGRETANALLPLRSEGIPKINGFIGRPVLSKGNRSFENIFVNGRYVKSRVFEKALEDAYQPYLMQHRYPFAVLYLEMDPESFDVNVHPTKMELRFSNEKEVYEAVYRAVSAALSEKELIEEVGFPETPDDMKKEPEEISAAIESPDNDPGNQDLSTDPESRESRPLSGNHSGPDTGSGQKDVRKQQTGKKLPEPFEYESRKEETEKRFSEKEPVFVQTELPETKLLSEEGLRKYRLIGQLFDTYWLLEMDEKLYVMDQHAAHEKVLYEKMLRELSEKKILTEKLSPPIVVTLTGKEEAILNRYMNAFSELGYEISNFGGKEYAISGVPYNLYGVSPRELFTEVLAGLSDDFSRMNFESVTAKLASMSCKAAIKGNEKRSREEIETLLSELLTLENPYACPHGRPTMIAITKHELEVKFKRIV